MPEFVGKDEADPMTDNWVASVVEHDSVDAHRKRCRHQRILTSARRRIRARGYARPARATLPRRWRCGARRAPGQSAAAQETA